MATKQNRFFDLSKLVGNTKKELEAAKYLTEEDKKRIGNLIVEQIRERTRAGVGVDSSGREVQLSTRPYSPSYAAKKGVSRTDVDLTLTGDLLENMFVKDVSSSTIEISVKNRDYGKLRGAEEGVRQKTEGGRTKIVKRPFFNVSKNDLEKIKQSGTFKRIFENATERFIEEKSKKIERQK